MYSLPENKVTSSVSPSFTQTLDFILGFLHNAVVNEVRLLEDVHHSACQFHLQCLTDTVTGRGENFIRSYTAIVSRYITQVFKQYGVLYGENPRTLKYSRNPQLLDERLEDQMERVMTLWGAPMDVGSQRSP